LPSLAELIDSLGDNVSKGLPDVLMFSLRTDSHPTLINCDGFPKSVLLISFILPRKLFEMFGTDENGIKDLFENEIGDSFSGALPSHISMSDIFFDKDFEGGIVGNYTYISNFSNLHGHYEGARSAVNKIAKLLKIRRWEHEISKYVDLDRAGVITSPIPTRTLVRDLPNSVPPYRVEGSFITDKLTGFAGGAVHITRLQDFFYDDWSHAAKAIKRKHPKFPMHKYIWCSCGAPSKIDIYERVNGRSLLERRSFKFVANLNPESIVLNSCKINVPSIRKFKLYHDIELNMVPKSWRRFLREWNGDGGQEAIMDYIFPKVRVSNACF